MSKTNEKVTRLVKKVLENEIPRFVRGKDLLELCLFNMRNNASMACINNEPGSVVNALVDEAEELDAIVYNYELKQTHLKFYKEQYVPICVCENVKTVGLDESIDCEACNSANKE